MTASNGSSPLLGWTNVSIGFCFILLDVVLSRLLNLGISSSLLIASLRCVVQLTIMGLYLEKVFASDSIWGVVGIAFALNVLGAFEVTFNKAKGRFSYMFPLILVSMLSATVPISILGTRFAMSQQRFWQPDQFIPIVGMMLGNAISSIGVGWNTVQKEFTENRDKIETYLALGASRFEACKPVATGALKVALLPIVNQLSVIGLISIPGMMTGAIIGGKPVDQAARLQMIIMFTATSTLSVVMSLFFACRTLIDDKHRIRTDRIDMRKPAFYRWRDETASKLWKGMTFKRSSGSGETQALLSDGR